MKEHTITSWQKRIFILCWSAYAVAYLCRTNLSIALPEMIKAFHWSKTSAGLIGTSFFWAYAVGQLINGNIGDRVPGRFFVFTGLSAAAFVNLAVGFSGQLPVIIFLWVINGFFLSTLWGPIIRTLSFWFPHEQRTAVAVGISSSMIIGYLAAWGAAGRIIAFVSWRWAFRIPAIVAMVYALIWILNIKNRPEEIGLSSPNHLIAAQEVEAKDTRERNSPSLGRLILSSRLWIVALACIAQGVIKDGITLWGPTFLGDTQNLGQGTLAMFSLVIPLMSLGGIFSAGWLNQRMHSHEKNTIMILLASAAFSCFLLYNFMNINVYVSTLLLSLAAAFTYGANTLLLTIIPLGFARYNKVSGIAGFLDFCSYMGAALAGVLAGVIIDHFGWKNVVILWMTLAALGVIGIWIAKKYEGSFVQPLEDPE